MLIILWKVLKPICVSILWVMAMILFIIVTTMCYVLFFQKYTYEDSFSGQINLFDTRWVIDKNPIDTFKRYWKGEFFI